MRRFSGILITILTLGLAGCPFGVANLKAVAPLQVEGIAVAPVSQLKAVAPLTSVTTLTQASAFRTAGLEALGEQGYVPNAKISVLDGSLQPVADAVEATTDGSGKFSLRLPTTRAYILRLEYGNEKKISLFAFARASESGSSSVTVDVPGTLATHLLIRKLSQTPGLLNEFSPAEIGQIRDEIGAHLQPEDVPDLTQITSILDRVSQIEKRLAALESRVNELEKKVDTLLGQTNSSPSPTPSPVPTSSPTVSSSPTPSPTPTATPIAARGVEIQHIEYKPADNYLNEFVVIVNYGTTTVDMTNWTLKDKAGATYTFPTFSLAPAATVSVYNLSGTNSESQLYWNRTGTTAVWNNTGDTAYLRDASGNLVHEYSYTP